ncbi:MAG: PTS mannose/fructose/sorbose/N-acetylgalactosamine transporter subunit IIC [Mycoplasmatales bacterium]
MELHLWQIIVLSLLAAYAQYDGLHALTGIVKPVVMGTVTGIIMGDIQMGLYVGGTINLMALGVGNFGGASVPDYMTATLLGTVFAVTSGQGAEFGVALAVPIGVLLVQLDVLARFSNLFFQKRADKAFEKRQYDKIITWNQLGVICWGISRAVPVFIGITLGPDVVSKIVEFMPTVLIDGMKTAGGLLPALGLAILLRYMPLNDNISYAIIGFVLAAYLNMSILGISLIGFAIALLIFKNAEQADKMTPLTAMPTEDSNEIEGDE